MQGQVVGQVFKSRSKQHHVSLARWLVEYEGCAVRKARCHASFSFLQYRGIKDLHVGPAAVVAPGLCLLECGMAEVDLPYRCCASCARIITRILHLTVPQRNPRM